MKNDQQNDVQPSDRKPGGLLAYFRKRFFSYALLPLMMLSGMHRATADSRDKNSPATATNEQQLFESNMANDATRKKIENAGYERLKNKLSSFKVLKLFSPFGKSFDEARLSSKAQEGRRIKEYGFKKKDHAGADYTPLDKNGKLIARKDRIGMPVNALETMIVEESGKNSVLVKKGKHRRYAMTGFIRLRTVDGEREYTYRHIEPLNYVLSGDTISGGQAFAKIEKNSPFHPHVHIEVKENGRFQKDIVNNLIGDNGQIKRERIQSVEERLIGSYVSAQIRQGKTVETILEENTRNNQQAYGIDTSPEALIKFVIGEQVEGGLKYVSNDGGTKYGVTKNSYPHLNIRKLSEKKAIRLLKKDFWDVMNLDQYQENPAFQMVAFQAGMQIGTHRAMKMMEEVNGDAGKMLSSHAAKLDEWKTVGRERRIENVRAMMEKLETAEAVPLQGIYAQRAEQTQVANLLLLQEERNAFNEEYAQNKEMLKNIHPLMETGDRVLTTTGIAPKGVYTVEIAVAFKNPAPKIPPQQPPVEKSWKQRMHALYIQNTGQIVDKSSFAQGVTPQPAHTRASVLMN